MSQKFFITGIFTSIIVHILLIVALSLTDSTFKKKPIKPIEVTYQSIKTKKAKPIEKGKSKIKEVQRTELPKKINVIDKDFVQDFAIMADIKEISKIPSSVRIDKKRSPQFKASDLNRRIAIPVLKFEKMTNPKYLSYNHDLSQRIRNRALSNLMRANFDVGEVYLTFVLSSKGILKQVKVIEEKSEASSFLKEIALRSVREASPFPPYSKELNYPELTFNLLIYFREPG